jgi:hypothetical protein
MMLPTLIPYFFSINSLAGVPGFEPGLSVLETDVLTVDTIPLHKKDEGARMKDVQNQASVSKDEIKLSSFRLHPSSFIWSPYDQCVCGNGDRTC